MVNQMQVSVHLLTIFVLGLALVLGCVAMTLSTIVIVFYYPVARFWQCDLGIHVVIIQSH